MKLKIISKSGRIPKYETSGSAGFDIAAFVETPMVLKPGERALVPTGLYFELEPGYEAQVRARSGLAIKKGIGTIDSDYRGEVCVALINWGKEDFVIENGDRIAQVVIAKYEQVEFELAETLNDTARGAGGFGHTGV